MLTEAQSIARMNALYRTFGDAVPEEETPLTAGLSGAYVARVVDGRMPYVLRVGVRPAQMLGAAAAAGLAPRLVHLSDDATISDYVAPHPYPTDIGMQLARLLRKVHALPAPAGMVTHHQIDSAARFVAGFRSVKPPLAMDDVLARFDAVAASYERGPLVVCHNDLKPQNILFDGTRPWLIDWEAAFLNDPYSDLAIVADFFVDDDDAFLAAYHDRSPSEAELTRFRAMRFVMHVAYATLFATLAARAGASFDVEPPDARDFYARQIGNAMSATRDPATDLLRPEVQVRYALIHLAAARR